MIDEKGNIFLTLSEDREEALIYTPAGGEIKVLNGQYPREAAVAEVWEETGLKLSEQDLVHIGDPQLILPTPEYDLYDGVGILISSYLHTGKWNLNDIVLNKEPEKDCMIVDTVLLPLPCSMGEIDSWDINIYPNFAAKLLELNQLLREGKI